MYYILIFCTFVDTMLTRVHKALKKTFAINLYAGSINIVLYAYTKSLAVCETSVLIMSGSLQGEDKMV